MRSSSSRPLPDQIGRRGRVSSNSSVLEGQGPMPHLENPADLSALIDSLS